MERVITSIINSTKSLIAENTNIKFVIACLLGFLGDIVEGRNDVAIAIVLIYMADMLTGVVKQFFKDGEYLGFKDGWAKISSVRFFKGCIKFAVYIVFVIIGRGGDIVLGTGNFLLNFFFAFIFLTDSISVLENIRCIGFDVPNNLVDYLKKNLANLFKPKE